MFKAAYINATPSFATVAHPLVAITIIMHMPLPWLSTFLIVLEAVQTETRIQGILRHALEESTG